MTVVQARMGSTRLPGKVMRQVGGEPMIGQVMRRARSMGFPVILATTTEPDDDVLARLADAEGWAVSRGSADDVLDRFVRAVPSSSEWVVRVTADCPLFDPEVGRTVVRAAVEQRADYASNTLAPLTYPDGLDCEVVNAATLRLAAREATSSSDREHVTPYNWRNSTRFRCVNVTHESDLSNERWTVDDPRDLEFVRAVYDRLPVVGGHPSESMSATLAVLDAEPSLRELNRGLTRNSRYAG